MSWSLLLPFVFFAAGEGMVIGATERLLEGLVVLASLVRVSAFTSVSALSGFKAENVVVWLAVFFFARGWVGGTEGSVLVAAYFLYVTLRAAFG